MIAAFLYCSHFYYILVTTLARHTAEGSESLDLTKELWHESLGSLFSFSLVGKSFDASPLLVFAARHRLLLASARRTTVETCSAISQQDTETCGNFCRFSARPQTWKPFSRLSARRITVEPFSSFLSKHGDLSKFVPFFSKTADLWKHFPRFSARHTTPEPFSAVCLNSCAVLHKTTDQWKHLP